MQVYLDNAATTRCSDRAKELLLRYMTEEYGNPSSLHRMGKEAEDAVREAAKKIAKTIKAEEKEILFTSGGTESNNLALFGGAFANMRAGKHIITTSIEHASVSAPVEFLAKQGFLVTYLSVDTCGRISIEELKKALRPDTILVSIMMVNNEIGTLQPVEEAAAVIKDNNPDTLFHVDAIQAYGKYRIYPRRMGIDLMSVSGHKVHAPKGTGFLYIRDKAKIKPVLYGGGQQRGMRSGTENVPGIVALGEAAAESYEDFESKAAHMRAQRERLIEGITAVPGASVNGARQDGAAPHIVSVSIEGVRAEVMLHALEEKGVFVSAGSACSSNKPAVSRTLKSIRLRPELLDATVRFSLCAHTTCEEIDYAVEVLRETAPRLQKYTSK